ncbi:hypothetical protein JCM11641_007153, partial [Rhodosporidiobolus odoratus]
ALSTAFRGDNIRQIAWSDLTYHQHDLPGGKSKLPLLVVLSNNGKMNREGRLDQVGILRHRDPSFCGIFMVAMLLFMVDQVLTNKRPSFEPDFRSGIAGMGPYGHRSWYARRLFPGRMAKNAEGEDLDKDMAYASTLVSTRSSPISLSVS